MENVILGCITCGSLFTLESFSEDRVAICPRIDCKGILRHYEAEIAPLLLALEQNAIIVSDYHLPTPYDRSPIFTMTLQGLRDDSLELPPGFRLEVERTIVKDYPNSGNFLELMLEIARDKVAVFEWIAKIIDQ